jgi:hypothetical protein
VAIIQASSASVRHESGLLRALKAVGREVSVFLDAILYPGKIINEVKQMRSLLLEAQDIEARDPQRAALLRQRASRIGL